EMGLRYVSAPHATAVEFEARVRPVDERGAFACADERLSRVWAVAAATLHTSMQVLTVDGIKRDRLPWQGDQALAATANAYAFGDAAIARDGVIALGRPRHGFVNGIADYSLWWLVNNATLLTHFGVDPLVGEGAAIDGFASALWQQRDEAGLLRPAPGEHFRGADAEAVFIDWGAPVRGSDATAFQLLWAWALAATADTLDALGHDTAGAWRQRADEVAATVTRLAWDDDAGLWHDRVDRSGTGSAHPNVIAAVSGIGPSSPRMAATIRDGEVGTPFMRSYALTALHRLGDTAAALDELTDRWGRQLDRGALTFSEDFDVEGESPFAMYGRPFGRSMSHAWSSAPASLLPQLLLGLRPLAPGWAAFTIRPQLGDLAWAGATVPTPHGDVTVIADTRTVRAWLPAGTTLLDGDTRVTGPAVHERPAA
ncbi:MAG: alpha-L-rhamnosidase C-terminal domain-containing protein, partial [Aeromicrobium sp.]